MRSLFTLLACGYSFEAAFSRVYDRGPSPTYRARLNRAVFSSASRVTFRSWELAQREALRVRRIRCEVYADNSGIVGRSYFIIPE